MLNVLSAEFEQHSQDRELELTRLHKDLEAIQSYLNELIPMKYRGLIDDEQYLEQKSKLETDRSQLQTKLSTLEGHSDTSIKEEENKYDFITSLLERFRNGTIFDKREILLFLCNQPKILDGELRLELKEWLV